MYSGKLLHKQSSYLTSCTKEIGQVQKYLRAAALDVQVHNNFVTWARAFHKEFDAFALYVETVGEAEQPEWWPLVEWFQWFHLASCGNRRLHQDGRQLLKKDRPPNRHASPCGPVFTTKADFTQLGVGHCVDSALRRPPHCYSISISSQQSCADICDNDAQCSAYEWGQPAGTAVFCQLVYVGGIVGSCPNQFWANYHGQGGGSVDATAHSTGGRCYKKDGAPSLPTKSNFDLIGTGHCVDSASRRPPHCYTWYIPSQKVCAERCDNDARCSAYEWGQAAGNAVYCQLIYVGGIVGACPSPFFPNYVGQRGTSVDATAYAHSGAQCYKKRP